MPPRLVHICGHKAIPCTVYTPEPLSQTTRRDGLDKQPLGETSRGSKEKTQVRILIEL